MDNATSARLGTGRHYAVLLAAALVLALAAPQIAFAATQQISISGSKITGVVQKNYTGNKVFQSPVVSRSGKTLVKGKDYSLSYKNNVYPGTATVTVSGIGQYCGTVSRTFKIVRVSGTNYCLAQIKKAAKQHAATVTLPEGRVKVAELKEAVKLLSSKSMNIIFRDEWGGWDRN